MCSIQSKRSLEKSMFVFVIGLVLAACGYDDPFYGKGSGWDFVRFPLIKPYYAISSTDTEARWIVSLNNKSPLKEVSSIMEIEDVQKIAVLDNAIMVYTPDNTANRFGDHNFIFHWYILIPDEHLEIGFETEDKFLDYLRQNNMGEPNWQEPLSILQEYDQTGCLDWIPDCK